MPYRQWRANLAPGPWCARWTWRILGLGDCLGCPALGGDLGSRSDDLNEGLEHGDDLELDFLVAKPAVGVELLVGARDGQLEVKDAGPDRPEDLAGFGLCPYRAEPAGRGPDHRHRLIAQGAGSEWAREPVQCVLELPGDRAVVLGGRDQDGVGVGDLSVQPRHRSGSRVE